MRYSWALVIFILSIGFMLPGCSNPPTIQVCVRKGEKQEECKKEYYKEPKSEQAILDEKAQEILNECDKAKQQELFEECAGKVEKK